MFLPSVFGALPQYPEFLTGGVPSYLSKYFGGLFSKRQKIELNLLSVYYHSYYRSPFTQKSRPEVLPSDLL